MYRYLPDYGYADAIRALWPWREFGCQRATIRRLLADYREVHRLFDEALAFERTMMEWEIS